METPGVQTRSIDNQVLPPVGKWTIDTTHSAVQFVVRHMAISKVRRKFDTFEGTIFVAETRSIQCGGRDPGRQHQHRRPYSRRAPTIPGLPGRRALPGVAIPGPRRRSRQVMAGGRLSAS
jgi:YceI-like domain